MAPDSQSPGIAVPVIDKHDSFAQVSKKLAS